MGKHKPGAGDVPIMLGDQHLTLVPSYEACVAINKLAGNSLTVAMAKIMDKLDFEFVVEIVMIGIGESSPAIRKQIGEAIYKQGVISIAAECVLFVRTVTNGGVRPSDDALVHTIQNLDTVLTGMPDDLREEYAPPLEAMRRAVVERVREQLEEAGKEEALDPLSESQSASENTTTA